MNKDELLRRYRLENQDEGKDHLNTHADTAGFYALCALAFLLMVYQSFQSLPFGDIPSLLFIFLSVGSFYRYRRERERGLLLFSIMTGLVSGAFLIWYLLQTL